MAHARLTKFASAVGITSILLFGAVLTYRVHLFDSVGVRDIGQNVAQIPSSAVSEGYRAAPALMLGLALAAGLPLLTLLARIIRPLTRSPDATRRYRPRRDKGFEAEVPDAPNRMLGAPFVEVESGGKGLRCTIARDMLRIGREPDNDIRIRNVTVHRYHAAIHREDYDDWHITDLSGVEGNGLIVNGRRCCEARLNDGDLIQLGPGRIRFRAGLV
ncbi:MAG TPA: FHA domain-containing protein [Nitrospira sp.]|nr:FHA domain-containing protein [Nitrospira sp.]